MTDIVETLQHPLLSIISKCLDLCDNPSFNINDLLRYLDDFNTHYQRSSLSLSHRTSSAACISEVLQVQLERAMLDVREILDKDFARSSVYDMQVTRIKLLALQERITTSFQLFAALDLEFSNVEVQHGEVLVLSECYPFYYFEMEINVMRTEGVLSPSQVPTSSRMIEAAIGFCSSNESKVFDRRQAERLGKSVGSCGYYMTQDVILYQNEGDAESSRLSVDMMNDGQTTKLDFRLGAGFHPFTRNAFFTLSGKVVGVVPATIMDYPVPVVWFPKDNTRLSLAIEVKLHFPSTGRSSEVHPPSWFDEKSCNQSLLGVSDDGCVMYPHESQADTDRTQIIWANAPVPLTTNIFYFGIEVTKEKNHDGSEDISIGFTCTDSFYNNQLPGLYQNSCAYHSQQGNASILQNGSVQEVRLPTAFTSKDFNKMVKICLGVGLHYGTNEIFFVKDGELMGVVPNALRGSLKPVVVMKGGYIFSWKSPSVIKCRKLMQLSLVSSLCYKSPSVNSSRYWMRTVQCEGTEVYHQGWVSDFFGKSTVEYKGVASFRSFSVAPLGSAECFYFEVTICNNGDPPSACIAIGFSHHRVHEDDKLPGCYPSSIGYHGNSGCLFRCGESEDFGPSFGEGDIVGAGVNHITNTIFFTKNGELVGSTLNTLSCALFLVVGLGSVKARTQVNFGASPFAYKDLPSNPSEVVIYFPVRHGLDFLAS